MTTRETYILTFENHVIMASEDFEKVCEAIQKLKLPDFNVALWKEEKSQPLNEEVSVRLMNLMKDNQINYINEKFKIIEKTYKEDLENNKKKPEFIQ